MKFTLVRLCVLIALLPVVIGLAAMAIHWLLGCTGGVGPGATHCNYTSDAVGIALSGLSWLVLGFVLSVPLALLVALLGKAAGIGKSIDEGDHAA
jgi:hypothetical protein